MARNYAREYAQYHATAEQKKRRAQRNAARRAAIRAGRAKKGDGKDVHHIRHSKHGSLSNATGNLRVIPASRNRSMQ